MCYGQTNLDLEPDYPQQFGQLWNRLKDRCESVDTIWSSPLKRCHSLANFLAAQYNESPARENAPPDSQSPTVLIEQDLMELDFGEWEGRFYNEIPGDELQPWMQDFLHRRPPGGESYLELYERVKRAYERIVRRLANGDNQKANNPAGSEQTRAEQTQSDRNDSTEKAERSADTVIVTHGGVIRCFLKLLLQVPLEQSFCLKIDYGDILSFTLPHDSTDLQATE